MIKRTYKRFYFIAITDDVVDSYWSKNIQPFMKKGWVTWGTTPRATIFEGNRYYTNFNPNAFKLLNGNNHLKYEQ